MQSYFAYQLSGFWVMRLVSITNNFVIIHKTLALHAQYPAKMCRCWMFSAALRIRAFTLMSCTRPARHISGSPVLQSLLYFNRLFATIYFPINIFLCIYKVVFLNTMYPSVVASSIWLSAIHGPSPASLCISAKMKFILLGPTMSHALDSLLVQSLSGSECMRGFVATHAKR